MWDGIITDELRDLCRQYAEENDGIPPDGYDELCYDAMTYEEFIGYIKDALQRRCCIVDVVE